MVEPNPRPISTVRAVEHSRATPTKAAAKPQIGPAFQVLLEKLEGEALLLQRQSEAVHNAADLAPAVDRARQSLAQAFELRDQLLEAWRASRQQGQP